MPASTPTPPSIGGRRGRKSDVTAAEVEVSAAAIEANGFEATVDAVYADLGRGRTTVAKLLKVRRERLATTLTAATPALSPELIASVKAVQARLQLDADTRIEAIQRATQAQLDESTALLEATQAQLASATTEAAELRQHLAETQAQLTLTQTERNDAREQLATLTQRVIDLREQLQDRDRRIADQGAFADRQQDALTAAQQKIEHLLLANKHELNALREELVTAHVREMAAQQEAHVHALQDATADNVALSERLAEAQLSLALTREQAAAQTEHAANALMELAGARQRIETLTVDLALAQRDAKAAIARADDTSEALAAKSDALDLAQAERQQLQAEVDALRNRGVSAHNDDQNTS